MTPYSMVWDWRISRGCLNFIVLAACFFLSPTVSNFSSFILWVGIEGLGSSD